MTEVITETQSLPVTFVPNGPTLEVGSAEPILQAAMRNGYPLPHSCRNGICGSCKARIVAGEVDHGESSASALSDKERGEGYALLCQATPRSPVTVECTILEETKGIPFVRLPCRVHELEKLADDVMRIRLRLPASQTLKFLPGQYINIVAPGGIRRSLSLASVDASDGVIELHLRNYGGPFSKHVFQNMKANDLLRIEGPQGAFFIREKSAKPIIFVASGTGFAPVKAMIESEASKSHGRKMTLYWGGRRPQDLYLSQLAEEWVGKFGVTYVPVVSDAQPADSWSGRTGFVHQAVMEDFPDLSGHQVYACGAPIVVQAARDDFTAACQLPTEEFYADIFVPGGVKGS
nr:CDP-6-deoxy-delta-3,4-glucoseen reductase [uncultured Cupriavidus sp.]